MTKMTIRRRPCRIDDQGQGIIELANGEEILTVEKYNESFVLIITAEPIYEEDEEGAETD